MSAEIIATLVMGGVGLGVVGRMMARTRATPPKKPGGHVTVIAVLSYIPLSRPHGVDLVLIYPCGKARNSPPGAALKARRRTYEMAGAPVGKNPLSPRTAWWRIGPRRQGFAPPLRALDGSGPIRGATLFTRGKGGTAGR